MFNIVYIGNVLHTIDILSSNNEICVSAVIYQEGKVDPLDLSRYRDFRLIPVTNSESLSREIESIRPNVDFAIMYSFGIIVTEEIINSFTIYNFHPGSLRTNRGSSPINWAILLGWKKTEMTLYAISSGIDEGAIVSVHECNIFNYDTPKSLKYRLEGEIYSMIIELLLSINNKDNNRIIEKNGVYRKRITEKDYTINPEKDSIKVIHSKINSQAEYNGAILYLGEKKHYIKSYDEYIKLCEELDFL
jgi:methionyl-tRNA formyltransferase